MQPAIPVGRDHRNVWLPILCMLILCFVAQQLGVHPPNLFSPMHYTHIVHLYLLVKGHARRLPYCFQHVQFGCVSIYLISSPVSDTLLEEEVGVPRDSPLCLILPVFLLNPPNTEHFEKCPQSTPVIFQMEEDRNSQSRRSQPSHSQAEVSRAQASLHTTPFPLWLW